VHLAPLLCVARLCSTSLGSGAAGSRSHWRDRDPESRPPSAWLDQVLPLRRSTSLPPTSPPGRRRSAVRGLAATGGSSSGLQDRQRSRASARPVARLVAAHDRAREPARANAGPLALAACRTTLPCKRADSERTRPSREDSRHSSTLTGMPRCVRVSAGRAASANKAQLILSIARSAAAEVAPAAFRRLSSAASSARHPRPGPHRARGRRRRSPFGSEDPCA
jgi:hypothetical protein